MPNGHVSRDAALVFARFDVRNDFLMCHRSNILGLNLTREYLMNDVACSDLYEINNY